MKSEDLMVEDFVLWDKKIVQIDTIWRNSHTVKIITENGTFRDAFLTDISPIHITKEILEKNGFKTKTGIDYILGDDNEWIEFYPHENRLRRICKYTDEWDNHSKEKNITFICNVYSVHELQHALRMLKIDNNFKL